MWRNYSCILKDWDTLKGPMWAHSSQSIAKCWIETIFSWLSGHTAHIVFWFISNPKVLVRVVTSSFSYRWKLEFQPRQHPKSRHQASMYHNHLHVYRQVQTSLEVVQLSLLLPRTRKTKGCYMSIETYKDFF